MTQPIRLVRMRCTACRAPWAATTGTARSCPFCGSGRIVSAEDTLQRAFIGLRVPAWVARKVA